jgi:hypothetical protein
MTYETELKKFIGSKVLVVDNQGNKHEGICKGVNLHYFNVILMTDDEKIAIRNVVYMKRLRTKTREEVE